MLKEDKGNKKPGGCRAVGGGNIVVINNAYLTFV